MSIINICKQLLRRKHGQLNIFKVPVVSAVVCSQLVALLFLVQWLLLLPLCLRVFAFGLGFLIKFFVAFLVL